MNPSEIHTIDQENVSLNLTETSVSSNVSLSHSTTSVQSEQTGMPKSKSNTTSTKNSKLSKLKKKRSQVSNANMQRLRSRMWCFTLNNYTEDDLERLSSLKSTQVDYIIYGKEVGESGTPHLQGFVCFPSQKRLSLRQVKAIVGESHCSIPRLVTESIDYCKKDGDYTEFGTRPDQVQRRGRRDELEEFKESVKKGITDMKILRETHSNVTARYGKWCMEYILDHELQIKPKCHPLRIWQEQVYEKLKMEPNDREIMFIVDRLGNAGKSWFFDYYEYLHPNTTQVIIPGKKADMAFYLDNFKRVIFFDCPRSNQGECIQYGFLEQIKNGRVASGKYESRVKRFQHTPHVVVAMNESPDMFKLSEDRYWILEITNENKKMNTEKNESIVETLETLDIDDKENANTQNIPDSVTEDNTEDNDHKPEMIYEENEGERSVKLKGYL